MIKTLKEVFFTEAALGVEDLSDDMHVEISSGLLGGYSIELKGENSETLGSIEAKKTSSGCLGAYIVTDSKAKHGFGPLLYDLMMELVGSSGLTADRGSVSKDAGLVWKYYFENRSDVKKVKLDDEDNPETKQKEDDCDLSASKTQGSISLADKDEIVRPWLNYVYYASNKNRLKKLQSLNKLKNLLEGMVPQGDAESRPLHGAPTYFYQLGRSIDGPKDDGALKKARHWNDHDGLLDVEELEKKNNKKKQWYQKEGYEYKSPYKMSKKEFLDYEKPEPAPGYRLLYHETSNKNLKDIIKNGLRLEKSRSGETKDLPNTIWASTNPNGWYGKHPLVVFQVPVDEVEPTIEYAGTTVMIHRDVLPKDIVSVDPVFNTDLGKERLSFFRANSYADTYWDEHFGVKNKKRIRKESKEEQKEINWSKIDKRWTAESLHPKQTEHGLFYYYKSNPSKPIAGVTFSTLDDEDDRDVHINMVAVSPDYRRLGLGKSLIRDLSKEYGYNNIKWGMTTDSGAKLYKSMEDEMQAYRDRGYDIWGKSLKEALINEFSALSTAGIEASNVPPGEWDSQDAPRVDNKKYKKNKDFVNKLDVELVKTKKSLEIGISKLDPQHKRQVAIVSNSTSSIPWAEPEFLSGRGDHRISKLGYAKIASQDNNLGLDIYLFPYDPNWKRSEQMVQQIVKHQISNHGNRRRIMPEPDSEMFVSIKEAWKSLRDAFKKEH